MVPKPTGCTRTAMASIGINSSGGLICSRSISQPLVSSVYGTSMIRIPSQQQHRNIIHISSSSLRRPSPPFPITNTRSITRPLTVSRTLATSTSSSTSTSTLPQQPSTQSLSWNDYLSLRQKRRYYSLSSSIVTGFSTFAGGVSFLMTQDLEKLSGILFGLDPVMALGLGGVAFGAVGWLTGPFAGEALFRVAHRKVIGQMEVVSLFFFFIPSIWSWGGLAKAKRMMLMVITERNEFLS